MVDERIYTERELREIQNGAAAYDRLSEAQLAKQREYSERPLQKRDVVNEIYQAIEEDNLDYIHFLAEEIGVMNRVRETFRDNQEIQDYATLFIILDHEQVQKLTEEIERGRQKI
ncbi:MAG: hypothetical protein A4E70_01402 [Syntrophus sp. PtaU1.Bin005]|jgi:hypothetical protein|nr:MAG: hypothetical protein A4E69_02675 [Syntrophus sp. PtaB.Bin138]OPY81135.1 MAG: hypothetical protein A4E70_01402 [Syntrophus sp. PtaU1.Bin005]